MKSRWITNAIILVAATLTLASCARHRETKETYITKDLYKAVTNWDFVPNRHFSDGMVAVKDAETGLYGFRNTRGKLLIPCQFEMAGDFHEGLARVVVDNRNGFINKKGAVVIKPAFNRASNFSCGRAGVEQDGKWGFIDAEGTQVIPFQYEHAGEFADSLALVKIDGKYGYIDCSGTLVIPNIYDFAYSFRDMTANVQKDGEWMLINTRGEKRTRLHKKPLYHDGLIAVEKNGKWGYKDRQGNLVHSYLYDTAGEFHDGMAFVTKGEQPGIVDKNGFSTFNNRWQHARKAK